jgi:hypothetical protein
MSFIDDQYGDMLMHEAILRKAVEVYVKRNTPQKIVNDAITSFHNEAVNEGSKLETISRDILKTVARTKQVSEKQKNCLVKLLVYRDDDDYGANFGF